MVDAKGQNAAGRQGLSARARVLVVDDDAELAEVLADGLVERGYDAVAVVESREASRMLEQERVDVLVTDLRMPQVDGLALLAVSRRTSPERPVIVMTAFSALDSAIESIRQGAYHYLTKPFKVDELALFVARALDASKLRRETTSLKRALKESFGLANIVGRSGAMREVCDLVERLADARVPVLITGETGTGKGLVARAIHAQGRRAEAPFVAINCAAVPETLLESELFGHVKGAFTGATSNRIGLFEEADGGTLLLDEVGEMSPALQAKLLHVLEQGTVRALGSNKERPVDTRIVAATHRDLHERVRSGAFREDLLYRLDVVRVEVPSLRHRRDDIPDLLAHFLKQALARHPQSPARAFSPDVLLRLMEHPWPGNVRELEHAVERLVVLGRDAQVTLAELPPSMRTPAKDDFAFSGSTVPMREIQRRYAAWAYERLGGRKLATAEKLGIDVKTLGRLLAEEPEADPTGT